MFLDVMIYIQFYFISLIMLILMYKFMLMVLLMLELLVMSMVLIMYVILSNMNLEVYLIFYLVFSVCEAVFGLSILVSVIRFHSNDFYYVYNMSKF